MKFEDTVGQKFTFYGVDNNCFKIGKHVFEAVEDPSDGYRSYLGSVEVKDPTGLVFFKRAIAKVKVVNTNELNINGFEGYALVDVADGNVWLRFGTDNGDNYYPYFVFEYSPPRITCSK